MRKRDFGKGPLVGLMMAACMAFAGAAPAADWTNSGGNVGRNGLSVEIGPDSPQILWSGGRQSLIAWLAVTEGSRLFTVRQLDWAGEPNDSLVVAMDLETGGELWTKEIPYEEGDWTCWIHGVKEGRVYASRGGDGASAPLYALDAATGNILWVSEAEIEAIGYDGGVFAPDGDPVIGSQWNLLRIRAEDGTTAWSSPRVGSVSSSCGGAVFGDAVYIADAAPGGHIIRRFDLETGALEYESPVMPGFTLQNTPLAGPDGTIYLSRTQSNESVDFFYAFQDTGSALVEKWHVPAGWSTFSEFAVGPDGSVYMIGPGQKLQRLDPDTGEILDESDSLADLSYAPRMAADAEGRVFLADGDDHLVAFNPDLTQRWVETVPGLNIGGPALGSGGTLVVCGAGTEVRAYRTALPSFLAAGPGPAQANPPIVRVFPPRQDAGFEVEFGAYGPQHFGVNVGAGELTGDGASEILTGPGPGEVFGPHVRGFRLDGAPLPGLSFLAYGTHKFGVNVAAADLDGDGTDEILTGAGPGAVFGPHVRAFAYDPAAQSVAPVPGVSFLAYGTHKWGVNVAGGDIDGDGYGEIVTGAGPGAVFGPHVRGWNVDGGAAAAIPAVSFLAYGTHRWGAVVSCGDPDGDGIDEIVTAPGPFSGFGAHVRGWNYDGSAVTPLPGCSFFAWPPAEAHGGARVFAGADLDGDGRDELVVGGGPDPTLGSPVRVFRYAGSVAEAWFSLEAFPGGWTHGATVAAGRR